MKYTSLLIFFVFGILGVQAQKDLEGLWQGTMSVGGINSSKTVRFQLYLKVNGKDLEGKSIVYLQDGSIVEMEVKGYMYGDRSVYMEDAKFLPLREDDEEEKAPFFRKYQFLYNRSIWESSLEGYWQQRKIDPFNKTRERGRISLKRIKSKV